MPIGGVHIPLDFISCVQTWISSWISSGATSLRVHDSSHRGFGGATGSGAALAPFCLSLDVKTFLKNGILRYGGEPRGGLGCIHCRRQIRGDAVVYGSEGARRGRGSAMQGQELYNAW
jgi:hypothetical protein